MSNESLKNVLLSAAKVFVAPRGEVAELKKDLSNAKDIITACDALITSGTAKRIGSVVDVKLTIGKGNEIEVKTDDKGHLLRASMSDAKVSGSWYETLDFDAIKQFFNIKVVDVPTGSGVTKAYTIAGQKLTASVMPECVVILQGMENDTNTPVNVYLTSSAFTGELVFSFIDYVRAGSVENSPFEFTANQGGGWLIKRDKE
ncbi:MAG: hypothetical protein Q4B28_06870 [bacterium]|nr:hypothetical protein [bacterium]